MKYEIYSLAERIDLRHAFKEVDDQAWPPSLEYLDWDDVFKETQGVDFPEYHFVVTVDGKTAGNIGSIPFKLDRPVEDLPEEGWDWMLRKGTTDKLSGIQPDTLGGLQVAITNEFQGKGLSSLMVKSMIAAARDHGFTRVVIPVRPTMKSEYPYESMAQYLQRKREDGLSIDPWLRVHEKLGGSIIKPCNAAMYIHNSVAEWERCTGQSFPASGEYLVEGALCPVHIDIENDEGTYREPNVWIVHDVPYDTAHQDKA